ncbi:MAG: alginate export family protein [Acidobacteria bacterium]|nr:alginate export family protein [Acidobacteriota bacterium]
MGAGQFGDWGRLAHRAGAIALEGGYQFSGGWADKLKPWLRAGYFRSSGTAIPLAASHNTFFQVLPTPRIYARFPFYDLVNNEDVFAEFRLKPHSKVGLRTDIHHLRLSNTNDQWYLGGGAFQNGTFGYAGRPSM